MAPVIARDVDRAASFFTAMRRSNFLNYPSCRSQRPLEAAFEAPSQSGGAHRVLGLCHGIEVVAHGGNMRCEGDAIKTDFSAIQLRRRRAG
jgi:hypothetical protein